MKRNCASETRLLIILILLSQLWGCAPAVEPEVAKTVVSEADVSEPAVALRPVPNGPLLLRQDIALRQIVSVPGGAIRLALNPADDQLYLLNPTEGVFRIDIDTGTSTKILALAALGVEGLPAGMTFAADGTLYIVVNSLPGEPHTQATILRGTPAGGSWSWGVVAQTEPYPASGTNFDHLFNGIVVSPDGALLYVNSGSRTDHGEVEDNDGSFPGLRETGLTAKILRLPSDAVDLILPNDVTVLAENGWLFAEGTRNAYDLAFAPNGHLFAIDNGPDADYPDELNWLREGHHYGFPWRFGSYDNPQQFADYDPENDVYLNEDFVAVQWGTYANDPDYPAPPTTFTDPVVNQGPAATQYRTAAGGVAEASSLGETLATFTPHRSPLGLVFIGAELGPDYAGDGDWLGAFVLSWGSAGGDLDDIGQDLLHLALSQQEDNYAVTSTPIAREFKRPIDAVLIDNRLYVLEWEAGAVWELTFAMEETE